MGAGCYDFFFSARSPNASQINFTDRPVADREIDSVSIMFVWEIKLFGRARKWNTSRFRFRGYYKTSGLDDRRPVRLTVHTIELLLPPFFPSFLHFHNGHGSRTKRVMSRTQPAEFVLRTSRAANDCDSSLTEILVDRQ
ncbi:hypothetical protein EVAR_20407_1 [Eumeta japonica]|uniref:Uncharacterized protein n=1 Tax=Eumeta variegata TaxID=151549 RepID=A0A4C1TZ50_EUMVA|nr:hypothetical protein EVAR_20407_1 [Eumeta japonica]